MSEMTSQAGGMDLTMQPIGKEALIQATKTLREYKEGKTQLEKRIIETEKWWKLRHWDVLDAQGGPSGSPYDPRPKSAWLFNVLMGKHADHMESYPEPLILPREQMDKGESQMLSNIIPVVMAQNNFEDAYSQAGWAKNKSGTAVYGCFWDPEKLNGLGDVSIRTVDVLNLFWQPGVVDIQESRNLFHVELADVKDLEDQYPHLKGQLKPGQAVQVAEYVYDDRIKKDQKTMVVDWYYKKRVQNRTVLHYCKFVGEHVLFASENDPEMAETGWYGDGEFPFVFDALFPVEGSPCGYGYIDICKSPQTVIDLLDQQITKSAMIGATPRYFATDQAGINLEEFTDLTKPIVHATELSDIGLRPVDVPQLGSIYIDVKNQKIEEMKYTAANLDVSNGSAGGVTAASAIAALQETAGRSSRDSIRASYRAYAKLVTMVIERIRQFYDIPRQFRILGPQQMEKYIWYSNANLQMTQQAGFGDMMEARKPVFDVDVRAQKQTAYSRLSQNELAVQFYQMGVFNPQAADQALMMLDMMDFSGKDEMEQKIRESAMRYQMMMQQVMMQGGMPQPGQAQGGEDPRQPRTGQPQRQAGPGEASHMQRARVQAHQATQPGL